MSHSNETLVFERLRSNSVDDELTFFGKYQGYKVHATIGSKYVEINIDYKDKAVNNFFGTLWFPVNKLEEIAIGVMEIVGIIKRYDDERTD